MPTAYIAAKARYRADSYTSLTQLVNYISSGAFTTQLSSPAYAQKWDALGKDHAAHLAAIAEAAKPKEDGSFGTGHLISTLKKLVPEDTIWAIEAVTNTPFVSDNVQASLPGSWLNCGAGGLGWSGGAALGIKMAGDYEGKPKFVVQVVGDGSFLFSVPSSVYWIAQRYKIPILTIVLNNDGMSHLSPCFLPSL